MKTKDTKKLKDYPGFFVNHRTEALDAALKLFMESFQEYAQKNSLNETQISSFKEIILRNYLERKAMLYLDSKLDNVSEYINQSFNIALRNSFDSSEIDEDTKFFYYKNKRHIKSNEQY